MIYHYKKGTPSIVGGAGDGTKADPWYWYRLTEGQTVDVDNSNADSSDNCRLYFRVKLKGGTPYRIGQSRPGGGDGRIKLYDDSWVEVHDNDDSSATIAGVSCSDHFTYTPAADGVFYIGAGAYSTARGAFSVAINPAPEQEPLPNIQLVYPTSSGFNKAGRAVRHRSASSAECNIVRIPKDGLVFYASLSGNMPAAESGQTLTSVGTVTYGTVDGIHCADFARSAYLYTDAISNFPVGSSDRTLSCFVKIDSDSSGRHGVLSYGNGGGYGTLFGMEVRSKKLAICGANSSGNEASSTSTFDITTWNHVAIKYQSGVVKFYINGVLDGNFTYNYNTQLSRLWIGILDGSNCYEPKKIAACRIYDRALTDEEIQQLATEFSKKSSGDDADTGSNDSDSGNDGDDSERTCDFCSNIAINNCMECGQFYCEHHDGGGSLCVDCRNPIPTSCEDCGNTVQEIDLTYCEQCGKYLCPGCFTYADHRISCP